MSKVQIVPERFLYKIWMRMEGKKISMTWKEDQAGKRSPMTLIRKVVEKQNAYGLDFSNMQEMANKVNS